MKTLLRVIGWFYVVVIVIAFLAHQTFDLGLVGLTVLGFFWAARILDGQEQINQKLDEQRLILNAMGEIVSKQKRENSKSESSIVQPATKYPFPE